MSRKKMLIAMTAVALGIAGAVSSAQAGNDKYDDSAGQGGIKIGPLGQTFGGPPARDALGAYALDESSKSNKKAPKHEKTGPTSTSGAPARAESDEAARLRRYEENH